MPADLPAVSLPTNEWVNLYAAAGINVGQRLILENIGVADIYVAVSATQPVKPHTAYSVLRRDSDYRLTNTLGDPGAWAFCPSDSGKISVSVHEGFQPVLRIDATRGVGGGMNLDAWGRQKTVSDYRLVDALFTFGIPKSKFLVYEDHVEVDPGASTRAATTDGYLNITSGAAAGNSTSVEARRHPRYQPNRGLVFSASVGFKSANLDGVAEAGLFVNSENGAYFKTIGDGNLYACVRTLSVETHRELINFPFPIDITKGNIYDIQMQWRGVGDIKFYAGNPTTGLLEVVHTIKFLNTLDSAVSISNPSMSLAFYVENVTQEVSMWVGCADVSAEGGRAPQLQYTEADASVAALSAGLPILAVRSPLTVGGNINTRDAELERIILTADKKSTIRAYRTRDPAAVIGGAWLPITSGSFLEYNATIVAVNLLLMEQFATFQLQAGATLSWTNPNPAQLDLSVIHGDYVVLVLAAGSIVQVDATIELGEEV